MLSVQKKQPFIWHQHPCAYDLEQEGSKPYLTGSYICPVCGKRKPVAEWTSSASNQQTQCVRSDILLQWKQSLSDEIVIREDAYTALRGHIGSAQCAKELIGGSAQLIERAIASCRDTLQRLDVYADILHRSERFLLRDRG